MPQVKSVYSRVKPGLLLHLIVNINSTEDRVDFSNFQDLLQVSSVKKSKDERPIPHFHRKRFFWGRRIIQESWFVVSGKIQVQLYDIDNSLICAETLNPGFLNITYAGGHTFVTKSNDTIILEHKLGPYKGQLKDKVQFLD